MDQSELFSRLGVALAIGLLVGLERGWSKRDEEDHLRAAGFRTFALSGLLGGVAGLVSVSAGGVVVGIVFIGFAAAFTAFHWLEAVADRDLSVTSVIAGLITFLLGALAILGDIGVAIAGAVAMTVLLALREQLHRWVASLTWKEVRSVLILLAMSFLLLPILPNRTIDPWNTVNPYEIWLLTVLIAAESFAGYVAVKVLGDRMGVLLAAVAGGLASSTATTLALARMGREHPESARLISAGILLAGSVMMARVATVMLLNPPLFSRIVGPLAAAGAVLVSAAVLLTRRSSGGQRAELNIDNPLPIGTALRLGAIIAIIAIVMLAAAYLQRIFGSAGVLAVSGVVDADAITISMARHGGAGGLDMQTAMSAILVGVIVNTLSKGVLTLATGGRKIGLLVGTASFIALATGLLAATLLH